MKFGEVVEESVPKVTSKVSELFNGFVNFITVFAFISETRPLVNGILVFHK